jgi:type II secretory pathway component GspD/PulD (secretin)
VSVDVVDTDMDVVLAYVARRIGAEITRQGNMVFVGNLRREDRGWLVRKARRMSGDDAKRILTTMKTENGNVDSTVDGIVVVSDRVRVLQSMSSMLDRVESQPATTWIVQLYMISTADKGTRELGFDTSATLDVSAVLADRTFTRVTDGKLQAVLRAARTSSNFDIIAEPMRLMVDGGASTIKDGEKIPIPQRTVSNNGTVTTTGYTYVDTGIIVKAGLREISPRRANCQLTVDLTQVSGYVESSPITSGQNFQTAAILESGGTYLVGAMSCKSTTYEKGGAFFDSVRGRSDDDGTVMIWLRCYRIRGSYERGGSFSP